MSKLLSSVPVTNIQDLIISIGDYSFPENTKIEDAPKAEGIICALETSEGGLYLSFGVEEEDGSVPVAFEDGLQQEYFADSIPHVIPILEGAGILFGGHPKPRPPKVVINES